MPVIAVRQTPFIKSLLNKKEKESREKQKTTIAKLPAGTIDWFRIGWRLAVSTWNVNEHQSR